VPGRLEIVSPIADRRDPGIERLQGAPQGTGVDVLRGMARGDSVQDGRVIARAGHLRSEPTDSALPHVPVSVNQAGDHEAAPSVDHLRVRCRRSEMGADFGDDTVTDKHVAVDEVTKTRLDSDNVTTFNKDLFGHDGSNLRYSTDAGMTSVRENTVTVNRGSVTRDDARASR
jgi:hypothetical protein